MGVALTEPYPIYDSAQRAPLLKYLEVTTHLIMHICSAAFTPFYLEYDWGSLQVYVSL